MSQQEVKFNDFVKSTAARKLMQINNPAKYKKFIKKLRLLGADDMEVLSGKPRYDERIY
ncbi:MAG: hypothetical protein GOVbin1230_31 [Prokaryotic dsDNA virus sp.]|nr:MAG: hypothetical protein GOVbin1230_31 [Prokaryotic dsDNA virus sp.]|tara:strand:- start:734 stop:910 length:177 start_codon:yes stop_codon:yes gene_type:complete